MKLAEPSIINENGILDKINKGFELDYTELKLLREWFNDFYKIVKEQGFDNDRLDKAKRYLENDTD